VVQTEIKKNFQHLLLGFLVDVVTVGEGFAFLGFSFMTSSPRQSADLVAKSLFGF